MNKALCKYRGVLVIAELIQSSGEGSCPLCGNKSFSEYNGWIECNTCYDYAILESHLEDFKNTRSKIGLHNENRTDV